MCYDADDCLFTADSYLPAFVSVLCCQSCAGIAESHGTNFQKFRS